MYICQKSWNSNNGKICLRRFSTSPFLWYNFYYSNSLSQKCWSKIISYHITIISQTRLIYAYRHFIIILLAVANSRLKNFETSGGPTWMARPLIYGLFKFQAKRFRNDWEILFFPKHFFILYMYYMYQYMECHRNNIIYAIYVMFFI